MGSEFGQWQEWNHDDSLDWRLLDYDRHIRIKKWMADLNRVYRSEPPLHELDCKAGGFEWIDCNDSSQSIVSFIRKPASGKNLVLVVCNFTPVPRLGYRLGVPRGGFWKEILNSDALDYGGSGMGNLGGIQASAEIWQDRPATLSMTLPPLAIVFFKSEGE